MHIYRFKLRFEDQDEFLREIDVRADQSFEDFHRAIIANLNLDPATFSSFFICNDHFKKKQEISLIDMAHEPEEDGEQHVFTMENSKLRNFIDDPHQKLLFIYDYLNYWTFYIELLKILPANESQAYPRIFRSEGEVPRELTATPGMMAGADKNIEMSFDEDVYDPEDLDQLEGEEDIFSEQADNPEGFEEDKF
jgi:hypothetical protein